MSGGWNTVESDAGVFTYLLEGLGAKDVQFEELWALDAETLQRLSPVYGVIFLFKWVSDKQAGDTPRDGSYDESAAENLFFAAQTIQNACGTQALLSLVLNHDDKINIGPQLKEFKEFTGQFPPDIRGETLSNSELIRTVHNSFARSSPFVDETQREAASSEDVYHFIAYTSLHDTLYELDGLQRAPLSHGPCTFAEFPEKVIPVLQRRVSRYPSDEIRFNLLAMCRDLRIASREAGDAVGLQLEERKRAEWQWENALRRHNFVGFVGELLKGVVKAKIQDGTYESWVHGARQKAVDRARKKAAGAGGGDEDVDMYG